MTHAALLGARMKEEALRAPSFDGVNSQKSSQRPGWAFWGVHFAA